MLSEQAKALWGKSDREANDGLWHPLVHHMLDVAACAEAILMREPASTRAMYATDFGFDTYEQAKPWLLSFLALHDLGKATPSFQALWPQGVKRVIDVGLVFRGDPQEIPFAPHGILSQVALCEDAQLAALLPNECLRLIADAVGCHHGLRATASELNVSDIVLGNNVWEKLRHELVNAILKLFGANLDDAPQIAALSAGGFYRLAGLTSFADWIGSNQDHFAFEPVVDDLAAYYARSLDKANTALDTIGWRERKPLRSTPIQFSQVPFGKKGQTYAPRPLQQAVVELLQEPTQPTLLLIEAPMGEGKTEAAFYAHIRLQQSLAHRGMYVALPTRATGNAMFSRTSGFLERMGRAEPVDLQLLHGSALLNKDYYNLKLRAINQAQKSSDGHAVRAQEWFSSKRRAMLTEYGVGTVDQALLAVLPIRHNFVRMWGLGNRTVVIDEVHAYDTYTSSLIETLLSWLHALGSSTIVMSATLPKERREALLRTYGATQIPQSVSYPRIFKVAGGQLEYKTFEADPQRRVRLEVKPCQATIKELVPQLLVSVESGGCVACIVNTVDRAQKIYLALQQQAKEQGIETHLFHARYPASQRQEIERTILGRFNDDGQRPAKSILVGTQVLEQSLDLDFDQMFTDLAPLDLILQRAGRIWRHNRDNRSRAQTKPILHIMGLLQQSEVPQLRQDASGEGLYWDVVYDRSILLRTFASLQNREHLHLPDDIDTLVQTIYESGVPANIPDALGQAITEAASAKERLHAQSLGVAAQAIVGMPTDDSWQNVANFEPYDPEENPDKHKAVLAQTRLGDLSVTVIPIHDVGGGKYKSGQYQFTLEEPLKDQTFQLGVELYKHNLTLSRADVVKALLEAGRPASWDEHPLLRNCFPLKLKNNRQRLRYTDIELDDVLGVRYHKL